KDEFNFLLAVSVSVFHFLASDGQLDITPGVGFDIPFCRGVTENGRRYSPNVHHGILAVFLGALLKEVRALVRDVAVERLRAVEMVLEVSIPVPLVALRRGSFFVRANIGEEDGVVEFGHSHVAIRWALFAGAGKVLPVLN